MKNNAHYLRVFALVDNPEYPANKIANCRVSALSNTPINQSARVKVEFKWSLSAL